MKRDEDMNLGRILCTWCYLVPLLLMSSSHQRFVYLYCAGIFFDAIVVVVVCCAAITTAVAATATTTVIQFFIVWFSISRETAGWRCVFFLLFSHFFALIISSFSCIFFFCEAWLLFTYFLRKSLRARKIFSFHFFHVFSPSSTTKTMRKKRLYYFLPHFLFALKAFRMLCISSIPVCIAMYSYRALLLLLLLLLPMLCFVLFMFMWPFFSRFYFTFTLFSHRNFLWRFQCFFNAFGFISLMRYFATLFFVKFVCCLKEVLWLC